MQKEVLVTGASGFIGRQVVSILLDKGYSVCGIYNDHEIVPKTNLRCVKLNLLDIEAVKDFLCKNFFDDCIHLAWYGDSKVHSHPINADWVSASLNLVKLFKTTGGKRLSVAGSISEYDFAYGCFREDLTPLKNKSLYGKCKASLFNILEQYCAQEGIDFKWARIFNLYGPYERPQRLMPSVINSMLKGEDVKVSTCEKFQDYLHVYDVAMAVVQQFESSYQGAVNICSAQPVQLRKIVEMIADITDFKGKICWGAIPTSFEDSIVVGNNDILVHKLGWKAKFSLEDGLRDVVNFYKE